MVKSVLFPFYINDNVMIAGRAGTVCQIAIRATDVLYYVATTDEAGRHYSDYFAEGLLSAAAGVSSGPFLTPIEYFALFTEAEQDDIFGSDIPVIRRAVAFASAAQYIDMSDPIVAASIDGLVAAGLLAADRADAVKAATPPPAPAPSAAAAPAPN